MNSILSRAGQPEVVERYKGTVANSVVTAEQTETREHRILQIIGYLLSLGRTTAREIANEKVDTYLSQVKEDISNLLRDRDDTNVGGLEFQSEGTGLPQDGPASFDVQSQASWDKVERDVMSQFAAAEQGIATAIGTRILIAEDDPTSLAIALAQLSKLGYSVDGVVNGAEAVESLKHGMYDLVLMDCQMPVMDGYEATRHIRQSENPTIPIIAVTAHVLPGDLDKCTRSGMNGFLPKPLDLSRLAAMIAKWCPLSLDRVNAVDDCTTLNTGASTFDPEALLDRLAGDKQLAKTILVGFLDVFPSQLHSLQERFFKADRKGARLQAHALKGSSATVGANSLCALSRELEAAAEEGELDYFDELLRRAMEEFEHLKSAVEKAGWLTTDFGTDS